MEIIENYLCRGPRLVLRATVHRDCFMHVLVHLEETKRNRCYNSVFTWLEAEISYCTLILNRLPETTAQKRKAAYTANAFVGEDLVTQNCFEMERQQQIWVARKEII